ncbi:MAG: LysR family transcriptional regulator [Candidatus Krumholzibacteria bacterium]|nr:LysR family transcriptional regulator [Candidatus Krumholzibacteria bacterium]
MEPGVKLYINTDEREGLFGDGKYLLLKAVSELGSLRKASIKLGRGYRKAWDDIRRTEEGLGRKIVLRSRGGSDGGSTRLTTFGSELLEAWERYRNEVSACLEKAWDEQLRGLLEKADENGRDA